MKVQRVIYKFFGGGWGLESRPSGIFVRRPNTAVSDFHAVRLYAQNSIYLETLNLKSRIPHVLVFSVEKNKMNCQLTDFFIKMNSLRFMGQINIVPEQLGSVSKSTNCWYVICNLPHTYCELQLNKWMIIEVIRKVEINTVRFKEHLV